MINEQHFSLNYFPNLAFAREISTKWLGSFGHCEYYWVKVEKDHILLKKIYT